ncbi:Peptidase S8/S53 subtilisin/kexin/sedolisin [Macrophomina phaseolina MS6]|uniref:tripeptidyl-peptidase II n=1 Tax=Macrophomina phaseolina (strain MS6) TaxID=1126212 RepID=K2QWF1_MACPH|nr:Peptidase S8/S53 subtilisin/kexin/sedolisin [Macrophomina phaseolina MS6]
MLGFLLVLLLMLGASASTLRPRAGYSVKDTFDAPASWSRIGPAPSDHVIHLHIGLKQGDFAELERHLYEVSDPHHERYGQHMSAEEVNELVKPADQTLDLVHEWLEENGILKTHLAYSPAKDWIKIALPVNRVEALLNAEYSVYEHESGDHLVRTSQWSLPHHLHEHVEAIQPTNSFFRTAPRTSYVKRVIEGKTQPLVQRKPNPVQSASSSHVLDVSHKCNSSWVTPDCLRTYYGIFDYAPRVPAKNSIGLVNFLNQTSKRTDVKAFLQQFRKEAVSAADQFTIEIVNGGDDTQTPNTEEQNNQTKNSEGDLDAELILSLGHPTPLIAYNTGGFAADFTPDAFYPENHNEPFLAWALHVLKKDDKDIPHVISSSYGDFEHTVPYDFAKKICDQFAQLAARGVSLLFPSGDLGVGPSGYCYSNDGRNASTFIAMFPASCPYVTAVGATAGFAPEVAAKDEDMPFFRSGGGFSRYFAQPNWQADAVSRYLKTHEGIEADLYNKSGRAYPDIAAQGQSIVHTWEGNTTALYGTSASVPIAATIIALVNDALIQAGRPALGFLNPWLYKSGSKFFHDIVDGDSAGCNTTGFPATVGWDPVTGVGSPNFTAVLAGLDLQMW